jgi:hypothetical protein
METAEGAEVDGEGGDLSLKLEWRGSGGFVAGCWSITAVAGDPHTADRLATLQGWNSAGIG